MAFHSPFLSGILPYRHLQHHKSVMFLCILYRAFCGSLIRVSSKLASNPCSRVPFPWTTRSSLIRMCSSLHTLTLSATRVHVERTVQGATSGALSSCVYYPMQAVDIRPQPSTISVTCSSQGPHAPLRAPCLDRTRALHCTP